MSINTHETHAAVVAAMREDAEGDEYTPDGILGQSLNCFAERAEEAHKREVDALNALIDDLRGQRDIWSKRADELVRKCNLHYSVANRLKDLVKRLCEGLETVYEREGIGYGSGEAYDDAKKYLAELDKGENSNCSQTTK